MKRGYIKQRITKFFNLIKQFNEDEDDVSELELRLPNIEESYNSLVQLQEELNELELRDEELAICASKFEEIEEDFYKAKSQVLKLINHFKQDEPVHQQQSNSIKIQQTGMSVKLPQINLPIFDGTSTKWTQFKETFDALINQHDQLSDVQKFHYLLSSLQGESKRVVEKIELTSAGYKIAWDELLKRYENKRAIIESHITELFKLKTMTKEYSEELRSLVHTTNIQLRALESLGQKTDQLYGLF